MTTFAIIGAGRQLGEALARRFGREGFSLALISRSQQHVDELAADLAADGLTAKGYAANVRDTDALVAALDLAAQELGPIEVLSYNPLPQKEFLRPLLESTVYDIKSACGCWAAARSCSSTAAAQCSPCSTSRAPRSRSRARPPTPRCSTRRCATPTSTSPS
jgi:hypothetical protein